MARDDFPLLFVAGAILRVCRVLTLSTRKLFRLEDFITMRHLDYGQGAPGHRSDRRMAA
jgi:hypothetical protein